MTPWRPQIYEMYGIDPDGPVPDVHQEVVFPENVFPLSESNQQQFLDGLSQLLEEQCHGYGLHQFTAAKQLLRDMVESTGLD